VLVELGLVEQRYKAVCEVFDGATVTEVATRYGVTRQTVHTWLRHYANGGLAALADKSLRPDRCPHQMTAATECASSSCAERTRGGVHAGSSPS
jgi:transposase-like protein